MLKVANTALTTVGNGTVTAASIIGQFLTRSGPSGIFTDTTDTAANILNALNMPNAGSAADPVTWLVRYVNTTANIATLAAGSGVTLSSQAPAPGSGTLAIAANSKATLLISAVPIAGTVAITILCREATI